MFKENHEDGDFGDYEYVDDGDWEHRAWELVRHKGYKEEQEDKEGKENEINGNGNNNGDEVEGGN